MSAILSKRRFLGYLTLAPLGLAGLKLAGFFPMNISSLIVSQAYAAGAAVPGGKGEAFSVPPLPYAADSLEKAIDAQTMELHHGKHHQAYVTKLNEEVAKDPNLQGLSLEDIVSSVSKYPAVVRNNAGGHWNHSFFWNIMTPEKTEISVELAAAINESFGSIEAFKKKFEESGTKQFGSGWVWLIVNKNKKLEIVSTPNQDNPLMDNAPAKGMPVLANDVWEHAYYLRYQNKRAAYLENWWNVVNWKKVSEHYAGALS